VSKMANASHKEVTQVVRRNIIAGHEEDYDDWLRRFISALRTVPGYLSTTVIEPSENPNLRYVVHRFTDEASMDAWVNSENRSKLLEEANRYSTPHYEKATGLETWFAIPGLQAAAAPPKWKMAIVTFFPAYLMSFCATLILNPIFMSMSFVVRLIFSNLIITLILVTGLTYVAMPSLSMLLKGWLYPSEKRDAY